MRLLKQYFLLFCCVTEEAAHVTETDSLKEFYVPRYTSQTDSAAALHCQVSVTNQT